MKATIGQNAKSVRRKLNLAFQQPGSCLDEALLWLFPPSCALCRDPLAISEGLCAPCFNKIHFISAPFCHHCGLPFADPPAMVSMKPVCADCLSLPPPFDEARALFRYTPTSRSLVLDLKRRADRRLINFFAQGLVNKACDWINQNRSTLVVPLPLHPRRLRKRGFNQSTWLASAFAKKAGLALASDLLQRRRDTPSQGGFSRRGRFRNVEGAFGITPSQASRALGCPVILIDDVMTTGASLRAASRALKKAGTSAIFALTLALVVPGIQDDEAA